MTRELILYATPVGPLADAKLRIDPAAPVQWDVASWERNALGSWARQ